MESARRGPDEQTSDMFSYLSPEQRVRPDHPLRSIRRLTDEARATLSPRFAAMYSTIGRPSIPPEQLLRVLRSQALSTVRSERLLASDVAAAFFDAVVTQARTAGLLSDEPFTVDSTQLDPGQSQPRSAPRPPAAAAGRSGQSDGEFPRRAPLHCDASVAPDPDAQLCRTGGAGAVLSYLGRVVLDNRHGLGGNPCVTAATGTAAWDAVEMLLADVRRGPVAGDKNYDMRRCVRLPGLKPRAQSPEPAGRLVTSSAGLRDRQPRTEKGPDPKTRPLCVVREP